MSYYYLFTTISKQSNMSTQTKLNPEAKPFFPTGFNPKAKPFFPTGLNPKAKEFVPKDKPRTILGDVTTDYYFLNLNPFE